MQYKIIVQNVTGSEQWELPFEKFSFTEELNKDRSANFSFKRASILPIAEAYDIDILYIFGATYREIYIFDEDDSKIYGGYISEMQFSAGEREEGTISVSSKGFFSLLEKRVTDANRVYSSDDSADIAWDLIDYTQNLTYGDFGITRGTHPATKNRDRTYRYNNIAEAIRKMSATEVREGFDFEVDNDKVFNIYYPLKGSQRDNIILESEYNIKTYNALRTFIDAMVNQAIVVGEGYDENTPVEVRDTLSQYKANFFLLQEVLSEKDVSVATTLQDKGDQYLEQYKFPRYIFSCTVDYEDPLFTDYQVGDRLRIEVPEWGISAFYRVTKRTCDDSGKVTLSFTSLLL